MKKIGLILCLGLVGLSSTRLLAKYEQEQMEIESQMQQRIESILSKTLPPNSYLVTVKVEMENHDRPSAQSTTAKREGSNTLLGKNQYVLPGVPQKKEFDGQPENATETTVSAFTAETLVKRIMINILVAPDVSEEQVRGIREVISGSIPFNPLRGDEMDIQSSSLLKPIHGSTGGNADRTPAPAASLWSSLSDRTNAPMLMFSGALITVFVLFIAFLFGPVRAFLNRLLAVLPRIGEQAAYTVSNAPAKAVPGASMNGNGAYGRDANGSHGSADEGARPFRFIREDQLNKLPILFKSMSAPQCALVLAYLPAEWASKVLGALPPEIQNTIMRELSQAREVQPEIVKAIEEQIKTKLPYLVGGVEWIQSVYQLTQPQTQRALLGTLNQQSPELAQTLRRKTFFLEDLSVISAGGLRLVFQELGYPTAALALRDEKAEYRAVLLNRLPVAMREILQQELDLSTDDKNAIAEAKMRLLDVGRRLLSDGRVSLPEARK